MPKAMKVTRPSITTERGSTMMPQPTVRSPAVNHSRTWWYSPMPVGRPLSNRSMRMGQKVTKHEPLAELYSPELIVAQEEFLITQRSASSRRPAGSRLTDVHSPELLESARAKLKYQGLSEQQIDELATIRQEAECVTLEICGCGPKRMR